MLFEPLTREEKKALKNRFNQKQRCHIDQKTVNTSQSTTERRIRNDHFNNSSQNIQKQQIQTIEKPRERSTGSNSKQNSDNQAILDVEIPLWVLYLIGGIAVLLLVATLIVLFFQDGPVIVY